MPAPSRQGGYVLPVALGAMLILAALLAVVMMSSLGAANSTEQDTSAYLAQAAAEAGIDDAIAVMAGSELMATFSGSTTVDGGSASYTAALSSGIWTITSTGTVPSTVAESGDVTRTVSVQATGNVVFPTSAWNYVYSDQTGGCLNLTSSVLISEPLFVRGDLCLDGSAQVTKDAGSLTVAGTIQTDGSATIGSSVPGTDLPTLHVGGGCRYGTSGSFDVPCTSAHQVWATTQDTVIPSVTKPPLNLQYWYETAKPGPMATCTSGTFPGGFDTDTTLNRSRSAVNLMQGSSYDCTYVVGATQVGRIAWVNGSPGTLTVDGAIFFDGDIVMNGSERALVAGRGTVYSSGRILLDGSVQICGAISGGNCNFSTGAWNPNTNLLSLVGGSSTDANGVDFNGLAEFQGAIYVENDYRQGGSSKVQGPVIARQLYFDSSSQAAWLPLTFFATGMPGSEPALIPGTWRG